MSSNNLTKKRRAKIMKTLPDGSKVDPNWYGKCTFCGEDNKKLTTMQLSGEKAYSIQLVKACAECRTKILHGFFLAIASINPSYQNAANMFNKEAKSSD